MGLKFYRKLGTDWVFALRWIDATGANQPLAGWVTPKAFWRNFLTETPIVTDTSGLVLNETADPLTFGKFTYTLPHGASQAPFTVGTYRLDFETTLGAAVVGTPEQDYVIVEVQD